MFSESSSVEEAFNFPDTNKPFSYSKGRVHPRHSQQQGPRENLYEDCDSKPPEKEKNKLYFKIQVIKKIGRFLQNLKAGVVLSKPNLKSSQLQYLQSQAKSAEKENLIAYDNWALISVETLLIVCLWLNVWCNSYEVIFSRFLEIPSIEVVTVGVYLVYVVFFLNAQFKNEKMELIVEKQVIRLYYLEQRLIYDVIIILTLILQMTPLDQIEPLFYLFRIATITMAKPIAQIAKKLQNIMSTSTDSEIIVSILGLFMKICLFLHILSLFFTSMSKAQKHMGTEITWVEGNSLQITSDLEQYIVGWYWGATVLSTVGFGDITPVNHTQRFCLSLIEVLCCIIFGFFVNYIGSLINMVGQSKKLYEKDMRKLNRYLMGQHLPDTLKSNIRTHFFNKYKVEQVYDPRTETQVMEKLNSNLKQQITQTRNKRVLSLSKFLKPFTEATISKLAKVAKKMVFAPQQLVYSVKSNEPKLWILQEGMVEEIPTFYNQKQHRPIAIYDKDNTKTIGWINFLLNKPYRTTARAKTFTLSYEIHQEDFYRILKENSLDYNKMHELKQTLIENKREYINKCLSCQRYTHNVLECPRIHFKSRSIFKILITEKKENFINSQKKKKIKIHRSNHKFNWKSYKDFFEYPLELEDILANHKNSQTPTIFKRCSVDSFIQCLNRNKSSQQDKFSSGKPSFDHIEVPQLKNERKNSLPSERELADFTFDKSSVIDSMDKVYLGENWGYFQQHNFNEVSKRYVLQKINLATNRNRP